jgi:hypothetical protein
MEHQTEGLGLRLSDQASRTEDLTDRPLSDVEESFADADEPVADFEESVADGGESFANDDEPFADGDANLADVGEPVADADASLADAGESVADVEGSFADVREPAGDRGEPRPATGDPRVDATLARLDELAGRPVSEHRAIFEDVHRRLRDVLGELDTRQSHADDRSDAASRPGR